jgi:aminomethyltransferase
LWGDLLEIGGNRISPVGLGARDTLRLEAGMPLYGNEIDETTDPFEAGLGFAVKLGKKVSFIGQESLRARKAKGPSRVLRGFRILGRRVARQDMKIYSESGEAMPEPTSQSAQGAQRGETDEVGIITSGAPSPTLGYPIAMGYLSSAILEKPEVSLFVDIRGRREPLRVELLPFYSRTRKKTI